MYEIDGSASSPGAKWVQSHTAVSKNASRSTQRTPGRGGGPPIPAGPLEGGRDGFNGGGREPKESAIHYKLRTIRGFVIPCCAGA